MTTLVERVVAIAAALDDGGIDWALGGALALAYATEEPRGTRDIDVEWQILSQTKLPTRRTRPKFGKVRTTQFPAVTTTGFELLAALTARIDQVRIERTDGTNRKGLLFPAPKGDWWWASGFAQKLFNPAAEAAGWERIDFVDACGKQRHEWVHTMHSLRHRFATDRINVYDYKPDELMAEGGWEDVNVIFSRYYGRSADALKRANAKLRAKSDPNRRS